MQQFLCKRRDHKKGSTLTDISTGLKYTISGTNLEVSSYTGSSTEVTIPATVVYSGTTYTVTRIGKEAFKNSGIKEITIPATVTTIGVSAFAGCDLETIVFEGETTPVLETETVKRWWDIFRWFEEEIGAFDDSDDMIVVVPEWCEDAHAGASGWSSYIEHITTDYSDTEWIGTKNNDWTNKTNWSSGVPTKYKNAVIHKVVESVTYKEKNRNKTVTVSYYPIIAGRKYGSATSYNNTAICNNIAFTPRAGVLGLHKLTYKRAVVQCQLNYDRWYAMTNPLKEMYSGDLYLSGLPLTYLMKFDKAHTENGHTYTQKWTKTYTGLQEPLVNGEGFAFKISSKCRDNTYKDGESQEMIFPRTDESGALITTVYKYNPLNGKLLSKGYTLDKTEKAYRFAMENEAPIAIIGGDAQGTITLTFKGAESFENVDVLLVNRQTGEEINLKDESSYTYVFDSTNATGNLYIVFRESEQITTSAEVTQNSTESINIYAHADKTFCLRLSCFLSFVNIFLAI